MNLNTNLPTIQNNEELKQAVDAKELYKSLGLNTSQWSRWASKNIESNPFAVEGLDFEGFDIVSSGNNTRNYLLSIDFAKKLAMQVRTEEGEQVRQYFLECEESAKQQTIKLPNFNNPVEAARAWANEVEQKQVIQHQLEVAAPKLDYYEKVLDQKELYTISEVAKKNGITAQELNKVLLEGGIYDKRTNGKTFKTDFMDKGYGKMVTARTGHTQAKLTIKGEIWVTTEAMKAPLAIKFLEARKAKSIKPIKNIARIEHTNNAIEQVAKLIA